MKFPLFFRRERSSAAELERRDNAERVVANGLRALGQVLARLADAVETRRLSRAGYAEQGKYLERTDEGAASRAPR